MAFITIPPGDVDQGSVVDESLMSGKIKNDLDDLNSRTIALEALSGGGSIASSDAEDMFADIVAGGEDDISRFWRVRHHLMMSTTGNGATSEGTDLDQSEKYDRFFSDPNFTIASAFNANANAYLGSNYFLEQNEQIQFKIKKGENFFAIGVLMTTTTATVMRVYVDGVNVNTLGLVDENDVAVPADIATNFGSVVYGKTFQFFGLDGEEHVITIKNENASALEIQVLYVDVGFKSVDFAIDHTLKLNAGVADVGGITADFNEGEHTFTKPTEGLANGYTGMLKIAQSGTVTAVDGLSPAATQTKPNTLLAFSGGAVTSLPVKNHFAFPNNGICLFQHPSGASYMFSYSGKSSPTIANQTLDSIIWASQPTEDFTPLVPAAGATYVVNEWRGDARIEYFARAPILIDGTNNKIDFEITYNGVTTLHAATIPSGWYSADLVPIEKAVRKAMQTAKSIQGQYFVTYDKRAQLWSIGVRGKQISKINFRWATGANSSSSFGPVLGFSSDIIDATSYVSPLIKQHLAQRVFVADQSFRSTEHPSIKYSWAISGNTSTPEADSLLASSSLPSYRRQAGAPGLLFDIYPDDDCCGMTLSFMREDVSTYMTYQIDRQDVTYLVQPSRPNDGVGPLRGTMVNCFISFPKGSRIITIKPEVNTWFQIESSTVFITFFGYRQHFTKPPWEVLTPQEKILKTFEVQPLRLFGTLYGHNTALYSPQASNDNINTITESGTWGQTTDNSSFNRKYRSSSTVGGYVEVEFVLVGDGGGIGLMSVVSTTTSQEMTIYLSTAAIVEGTDEIERMSIDWGTPKYDDILFVHMGLKAGTYTCRIKNDHSQTLVNTAIFIVDTVAPQPLATTHTELANTGQGLAFPLNVKRRNAQRYGIDKQPSYITEGAMKLGIVNSINYLVSTNSVLNNDDSIAVIQGSAQYFSAAAATLANAYFQMPAFCRSLVSLHTEFSTFSTVVTPQVDGVAAAANISMRECVKGGLAPSTTRDAPVRSFVKNFEYPISHNASLTFNMAFTDGLRNNQKVILFDGTNYEEAFVTNIVFNTSFDIKKALTTVVAANVTKVLTWGFHNLKMISGDALTHRLSAFEYEPLPLEWSVLQSRVTTLGKREDIREAFFSFSSAIIANGSVTFNFEYPFHSDGEAGDPTSSHIEVLRNTKTATNTGPLAYLINRGLKTIQIFNNVGVGITHTTTLYVKSRRQISKLINLLIRG